MKINYNRALAFIIIIAFLAVDTAAVYLAIGTIQEVLLILGSLFVSGLLIQRLMGFRGGYGFYMMGSKKGLETIDRISKKYDDFWNGMAIWGLTLGFGLLAYPLLKGRINKRAFALGILSLPLIIVYLLPYLGTASFQLINIPRIQNAIATQHSGAQTVHGVNYYAYLMAALTIVSGFSGVIFATILLNAATILSVILSSIYTALTGMGTPPSTSNLVPGVAPVIPGITIPLFSGIISLIIILVVHEFSHGILSRIARVRLKSIGLLVFGVIPIGAYVEPDENMIKKLDPIKQTKIFSAGISANFIAMIVFFLLLLLLTLYIVPSAYSFGIVVSGTSTGYPAYNVLKPGMQILKWNNYTISNVSDLIVAAANGVPNQTITIATNNGTFAFTAIPSPANSSRGVVGVELAYKPILKTSYARSVYFAYTLFGLSMLLNFLVAVVNLLPIPGFDGWRIYKVNIKSKNLVRFAAALIVMALFINAVPWIFKA